MQKDLTQHRILDGLFVESLGELLHAAGFQSEEAAEDDVEEPGDTFVSVLGATGDQLRLSATLKIDRNLLIGFHPLGLIGHAVSESDLEDWCRELNNQLVGRMKNKLLAYNVVVALGLPVLFTGTNVSISRASNQTVSEHQFKYKRGMIGASLATVAAKELDLILREQTEGADETLAEGALALF